MADQISTTKSQIISIRQAIRYHRTQISDYRCWVDDERIYQATWAGQLVVPKATEFLARCAAFWNNRQRPDEKGRGDPTTNSQLTPLNQATFSDSDLDTLDPDSLAKELKRLQDGVTAHQRKGYGQRTVADDETIYALLPEQIDWNSALPSREQFLTNCQRFCVHCQEHPGDLLEWAGS